MITKLTKNELHEVEQTRYDLCNMCGNAFEINDNTLHNLGVKFNWDSKITDMVWNFTLCEDCLMKLAKMMKFKPAGYGFSYDKSIEEYANALTNKYGKDIDAMLG